MHKQIIAHRGGAKLARENTLKAFKKALQLGADAVEMDIARTRDGILVTFHNRAISSRPIESLGFARLNRIAKKKGYIVPALSEVLKLVAGKARAHIEIKGLGYEDEVAKTALKLLKSNEFEIISYNFESLKKIKDKYPKIKVGLVVGGVTAHNFWRSKNRLLRPLDFLDLNWQFSSAGSLEKIPKKYPINIWVADEPRLIKRLLKNPRISGITTNRPDLALKLRKQIYGT